MNELFRAINKMATPKGKPVWGSPEWHKETYGTEWKSVTPQSGPVFDINSLDPLNHRKSPFGHDERVEREEAERDYEPGMFNG